VITLTTSDDITADDYELAEVALAATTSKELAIWMLVKECDWTLARAHLVCTRCRS
jgi:hypothetical protein